MSDGQLARSLGTTDAVFIGTAAMIGAGVFAAFAPAAEAAGAGLLIGLGIAAVVAYCNATSSAQLAAQYPTSGGTYVYGREQLNEWWGYLAGWGFVVGKTASCAAMAMTFAAYVAPDGWKRAFAVTAIVALTAVNYGGITRTAQAARVLVVLVLTALAVGIVAANLGVDSDPGDLSFVSEGWHGILQSAGLLFFAFAGYARIATLGEEVRDPTRTIPKAIVNALAITVLLYLVVALTLLATFDVNDLADSTEPIADAVEAGSWSWASPVVRVGASLAALGALLGLIAGVGRTSLAMSRNGDLPQWFGAVHETHRVPHHAEFAVGAAVIFLVLAVDLKGAIGFSSFGVLFYYFVANLAAYTQEKDQRRFAKPLQVLGAVGCLTLVATLPMSSVIGGVIVFAVGIAYRMIVVHRSN